MIHPYLLAGAAIAAVAAPAAAQPADFQAQAAVMVEAAYPADGAGAAVIVSRGGRILYAGGRGLADVEAGRPITPDTPFRLGSIVKQLTAAIVLQLVAEGRMSLDDPISRFLPDWPQPAAAATVRQLLSHSSGIQDVSKIPGWIGRNRMRTMTTAELLAAFRDLPPRAQPGHAWEYNNGGYILLGAIVEQVTGKAWHEVVAERIARPLGLRTLAHVPAADAARGYTEEGGHQVPVELSSMSVAHAAGGLQGSAADLARWAHALHHGRVVSPALYEEMVRPVRLADGTTRPYGFGLRLQQLRGRRMIAHGGAGGGLDTDTVYLPAEDLYVAILSNSDEPATDPSNLTRRLAALALGEPFPVFTRAPVDLAAVEPLFGSYRLERGPPMRFFARDGRLYVGRGDDEIEAFPAGGDRFFFGPERLMWFRIARAEGGAHVLELHTDEAAAPQRAVRTGAAPPPFAVAPALLQSYAGRYATEILELTIALAPDGALTVTPADQRTVRMRPVSDTEFHVDEGGYRIVFHPENGRADRLTLHRGARVLNGRRISP